MQQIIINFAKLQAEYFLQDPIISQNTTFILNLMRKITLPKIVAPNCLLEPI